MTARISRNEDDIDTSAERITSVESRVNDAETGISAQGLAIDNLSTRVTKTAGDITVQADRITAVQSRVTDTEGAIQAQGTSLTQLNTRVTGQGNTLTAQAGRLDVVEARAGEATASALMRLEAVAGPQSSVRFAYQFRRLTSHGYQSAGWYVDLSDGGPPTVVFDFTRFIITDHTSKAQPFRFEGGVAHLNTLVAASAIIGELQAVNIRAQSISTDKLAIAGVDTSRLGGGAASVVTVLNGGNGAAVGFTTDGGFVEIHGRLLPQGRNDNNRQGMTLSIDGVGNVLEINSATIPDAYRDDGSVQSYAYVPIPSFTVIYLNPGYYVFRLAAFPGASPSALVVIRNNKR